MDRVLWYLFAGSRGGPTRTRIVVALLEMPMNTNQLATALAMDYKTIEYQLRVLQKHAYVVTRMDGYGRAWEPSKNLLAALEEFAHIAGSRSATPGAPMDVGKAPNTSNRE